MKESISDLRALYLLIAILVRISLIEFKNTVYLKILTEGKTSFPGSSNILLKKSLADLSFISSEINAPMSTPEAYFSAIKGTIKKTRPLSDSKLRRRLLVSTSSAHFLRFLMISSLGSSVDILFTNSPLNPLGTVTGLRTSSRITDAIPVYPVMES